ncbi:MAG: RES family NAD+ phosphorylase [Kiloniellaceae bacterium]
MPEDHVHDPDLLDALESMEPRSFDGVVWRVTWATRNPLAGGTGGGRWHPPNDFEALYTSFDENGAMAEVYHHLSKAPVFSSSHVRMNKLRVRTERTLVFNDVAALEMVGVDEEAFRRGDISRSREIGAAARFLDMDGLIVPSARWPCTNLVLFLDRSPHLETLKVLDTREVNWPAWRETVSSKQAAKGAAGI